MCIRDSSQFEYLFTECARVNQKIYLFIDEYDHFTNTILSDVDSLNRYTDEDVYKRQSSRSVKIRFSGTAI